MTEFVVTEEHLALLRAAYLEWSDIEFGAPAIDPKRPYGNSDVLSDVIEILDIEHPRYDDPAFDGWLRDNEARLEALHRETLDALRIAVRTVKAGRYVQDADGDWRPAPAAAEAELWAVHVEGPDDVLAVADRRAAEAQAVEINAAYEEFQRRRAASEFDVRWHATVVPWDGTAEEHARELIKTQQDGGYLA